jgi:uncharacterized protein YkwD
VLIDVPPAPPPVASEFAIVHQVNRLREAFGLGRVHLTRRLNRVARRHNIDMLRHGRLTHDAGDGVSYVHRLDNVGYLLIGEALAFVPRSLKADARSVVWGWLMSDGHREQLLQPNYWRIGVSRITGTIGSEEGVAITVNFSTRN